MGQERGPGNGVVKRSLKITLEFVGVVIAGFTVLLLLAAMRLSYGPVPLDFLTPYIEKGLSADDGSIKVSVGATVLSWAGWQRTLDIQLSEVSAKSADGVEQAFIPDISVSFSMRALLDGRIAPTRLSLVGPRLTVMRRPDGSFAFGDSNVPQAATGQPAPGQATSQEEQSRLAGALTAEVISHLVGPPDHKGPLGYLTTVSLLNAEFVYDDRRAGVLVMAPGSDIVLSRDRGGVGGNARLNIVAGDKQAIINLAGGFNPANKTIDAVARFSGVTPAEFAGLAPVLAPLGMASFPLNGSIQARMTLDGKITDLSADMEAGAGTINAPQHFDAPVNLTRAEIKAHAGEGLSQIVLEAFTADFNGPRIALSGTATRKDGRIAVKLDAGARDVKTADLRRLWPRDAAPGGREWVLANIDKGGVRELRLGAEISAREDAAGNLGEVKLSKLDGGFDFSGLDIHYLRPLPPVSGVAGRASLSPSAIEFATSDGKLGALRVSEGKFRTYDLDTGIELLDLELVASGPISDVIKLLEHPRLDLIKGLGIKANDIKGVGATRLVLKFPLRKDLKFDHMQIAAASNLRDVALPGVALGNDLTDGELTLRLDKRGMDVGGTAKLGGVPASLKWTENFYSGARYTSRYDVKGIADEAARAKFGLDFLAPYIKGPVGADLIITKFDKRRMSLAGSVDVKDAALAFAELGWTKKPGVAGFARLRLAIEDDKARKIEELTIRAGDLKTEGSITLGPDGKSIAGFDFGELVFTGNDYRVRGAYREDDTLALDISGKTADIRFFLNQKDDGKPKRPLDIRVDLESVRAAPNAVISPVSGSLRRDSVDWQAMNINGKVGARATPLAMTIARVNGVRRLKIASADAGAALKAFDITDNMVGGTLNIDGSYDDAKPGRPLSGHFAVRTYHMEKAPFLAKLLGVASLTGLLDTLSGKGITFDRADMPFVKTGDDLEIKDGRAHGSAVGFTATGRIDLDKDVMNLTGTVVPAYSLNSVFGNLPLIGQILVPEKGSGLFAATYSMRGPIDNPDVTINPLATLTPGFLRGLFNIFDAPEKGQEKKAGPGAKTPAAPVPETPAP